MKVFHEQKEIDSLARIKQIASLYGVPWDEIQGIINMQIEGIAFNPSEIEEKYRRGAIEFYSKLTIGDALSESPSGVPSEVRKVDVTVEQLDRQIISTVVSGQVGFLSENGFTMNEDGRWIIDQSCPPSIQRSYDCVGAVLKCKNSADAISNKADWFLVDLILACEEFHGEAFDISQVAISTDRSLNWVKSLRNTGHWTRSYGKNNLPITHHTEVRCNSGLTDIERKQILDLAEEHSMTCRDIRRACKYAAKNGVEALKLKSPDELRKEERTQKKTQWIVIKGGRVMEAETDQGEDVVPFGDFAICRAGGRAYSSSGEEMRPVAKFQYCTWSGKRYVKPKS
tara:strand:- start:3596 stop:4618 length:1023 start_codon:yes stop_codon:yes gene_type:complete